MTPALLLSQPPAQGLAAQPNEAASLPESSEVSGRSDRLTYPCPHCGSVVRAKTALRVDDLRLVGWTPCRVATFVNTCGHAQSAIPWPQSDGSVRLIPVLRSSDLMPGVYVDLRDFVAQHHLCGRPIGDADPLKHHGHHVWARCRCGARFERWVVVDEAEADLLRSVLDDPRDWPSQSP